MTLAKTQKSHTRTCIVCRKAMDKACLLRIVKDNSGKVFVDVTGKAAGRGAYVCSAACLGLIKGANSISRALRANVNAEDYAKLQDQAHAAFASK